MFMHVLHEMWESEKGLCGWNGVGLGGFLPGMCDPVLCEVWCENRVVLGTEAGVCTVVIV